MIRDCGRSPIHSLAGMTRVFTKALNHTVVLLVLASISIPASDVSKR